VEAEARKGVKLIGSDHGFHALAVVLIPELSVASNPIHRIVDYLPNESAA